MPLRRLLIPFLALLAPMARAEIIEAAVFQGDAFACLGEEPALDPFLACLAEQGATPEALAFAQAAHGAGALGDFAVLTRFGERGVVDVGQVRLPGLANTNDQMVFLNATPPIVHPSRLISTQPLDEGGTRAVLRQFPTAAASGRLVILAHRALPNGRQRFVVTDVLTNGCRACDVAGTLVAFVEFDAGSVVATYPVGWTLPDGPGTASEAAAAIATGDGRELQRRLNYAGYFAGGMDGFAGDQTTAALEEFRAEFCLPPGGPVSRADAEALVLANRDGARGDCAMTGGEDALLPLRDGTYVSETRFCAPVDDPVRAGAGDLAYNRVIELSGVRMSFGENACDIGEITGTPAALTLQLACQSEGEASEQEMTLRILSDALFVMDGDTFLRCPG
jgi:peptidoglycan hydrolase-like protein with peptidoglycan-binding domain